ncbi:hypothetical protein D039_4636B, partial [Vibrio parahaemolyticus EKP-028]
NHSIGPVSGT